MTQAELATITALDAVRAGRCSGICLVANPDTVNTCDCSCNGAFHGVLAEVELTARLVPTEPAVCGAELGPDRFGFEQDIVCELEPGHPPVPAKFLHHNGAYGMWETPYAPCQCAARYPGGESP